MVSKEAYLIAYDISDDKKRAKVMSALLAYGNRVQYSVFEVILTDSQLKHLIDFFKEEINPKRDSIRIYRIGEETIKKAKRYGNPITLGILYDIYI
ncbi:MAG: CRISPR-associated endonuclease Cas2 [Thermoplasmata archaeon]